MTRWILTQVDNPRATPVERLLDLAKEQHLRVTALPNLRDAMDAVINSNDAVCITGSVALVGAARAVWAEKSRLFKPEYDD